MNVRGSALHKLPKLGIELAYYMSISLSKCGRFTMSLVPGNDLHLFSAGTSAQHAIYLAVRSASFPGVSSDPGTDRRAKT